MSKRPILKKKYIKDPIYGAHFWICQGTRDQFIKFVYIKSNNAAHSFVPEGATGASFKSDENIFFVWIKSKDLGVLTHELIHYVTCALGTRGLELGPATEEAFAYYYEYLFMQCYTFLFTKKKRIQKKNNERNQTNN